jgi:Kef-type K+ transport system membrane component KefB
MEERFLIDFLMIIIVAKLGEEVAKRIHQPGIIGQLIAGMLLGSILSYFSYSISEHVIILATIGILLLLFIAGLEIEFEDLLAVSISSFTVAILGVIVPFTAGFLLSKCFGYSGFQALFVATALVATSVGITVEVLREQKMISSHIGTLIVGAAVIDDILGIFLMSLFVGLAQPEFSADSQVKLIIGTILFFGISLGIGIWLPQKIQQRYWRKHHEKLPSYTRRYHRRRLVLMEEALLSCGLIILLIFSIIAHRIGIAMITGAFIAGLILGETKWKYRLLYRFSILAYAVFIPIFFVITGLRFDLQCLFSVSGGLFCVLLIIIAILSKFIGCGLGAKMFKFKAIPVGIAMVPRGEFAVLIAMIGLKYNIIDTALFSSILVMAVITALLTPPILKWSLSKIG